jgi:hypothetical protein
MITSVIPKLPFIDKAITLDFYVGRLGFVLHADYGDYLILQRDAAELHFFSYPTIVPGKSDFMIYLRVDNGIELLYEQWKNNGQHLPQMGMKNVKYLIEICDLYVIELRYL